MQTDNTTSVSENGHAAPLPTLPSDHELQATAPGQYRVIRRNGKVTSFDRDKIKVAVTKAFLAVEGGEAAASKRIHDIVERLTGHVQYALTRSRPDGGIFHIDQRREARLGAAWGPVALRTSTLNLMPPASARSTSTSPRT